MRSGVPSEGVPVVPGAPMPLDTHRSSQVSTLVAPIAATDGAHENEIHLRDLWRVLLKRKWAAISFLVVVVMATTIATTLQTPIYQAAIVLKIERDQPKVVKYEEVTPVDQGDSDFLRTQYELLKSRTLAERVVQQLNLRGGNGPVVANRPWWVKLFKRDAASQPAAGAAPSASRQRATVGAFRGSLAVAPVRNSRLINVYFDSPDPILAADALNALAENFINVNLEGRSQATSYAKTFLEEQTAQTKAKLEVAERTLVDFQRTQQIITIDEKQNVLQQSLSAFNAAATQAQQDRIKAETGYKEFVGNPESSSLVSGDKAIEQLREQRLKVLTEYQDQLRIYKPSFPKMQQLQAIIDQLDKEIVVQRARIGKAVEGTYRIAVAQEQKLLARLEESKKEMLDVQGRSIEYNILRRNVDTNRQFYDGLLQRLREVSVSGGVGVNNISVVDSAQVPSAPYKPSLERNLTIAAILGVIGGVGLAFFLEYLDDRVTRPEELERITRLAVLGVIPLVKKGRGGELPEIALESHKNIRSGFSESYRSVRTALQFATREGAPRQFIVTSTAAREGKSTTSLSLAINFAQTGQPVVIIDADLRNPTIHRHLGVPADKGLSNYLAADINPADIITPTQIPNLFLIRSGPMPPNPVELLSGPKLVALLEYLGTRFSRVVIDAPPVLGLADALVLGNQVGSVLFVVAAGSTRKAQCKVALKRLRQAGVQPVGTVLTKVDLSDGMYGYESSYYQYKSTNDIVSIPTA